jgi:hypothetical protein
MCPFAILMADIACFTFTATFFGTVRFFPSFRFAFFFAAFFFAIHIPAFLVSIIDAMSFDCKANARREIEELEAASDAAGEPERATCTYTTEGGTAQRPVDLPQDGSEGTEDHALCELAEISGRVVGGQTDAYPRFPAEIEEDARTYAEE